MNPLAYPFNAFTDLELAEPYRHAQQAPGLLRIQMPIGAPAWLATRYDDSTGGNSVLKCHLMNSDLHPIQATNP